MIYGLDIASHQGICDMAQLRQEGHDYCIAKCTGEGDYINPFYRPNHDRAVAAGLITGSYDWIEPQDARSGAWLAGDYLRAIGPRPAGHLLCVDFETPEWHTGPRGRDIEAFMREYLYTLKDRAAQPVIVYTAPYFLIETGAQHWAWLGRDFLYWMAAPGPATGPNNMLPDDAPWPGTVTGPWSVATLHQHQWYAQSAAIGSGAHFDRNRFRGDRAALLALGYQGTGGETQPQEENDVQEPPEGKFTAYINKAGNPIFVANFGGKTPRIDGINVQDLGLSVESATEPGVILDRSIVANEVKPYHDRRQDAQATQRPAGGIAVVEQEEP